VTDPRKQAFAPYLRTLADLMGLKDWQFTIADGPAGETALASVKPWYGRKGATIWLSESFLNNAPEEQRYVVTHELIHCHTEAGWEIADDAMPDEAKAAFKRMMEYAVDGIATALAAHLPLPPKGEPAMKKKGTKKGGCK
jgi:hypothetical protein